MQSRKIAYWISTSLVTFFIGGGGVAQLLQFYKAPHSIVPILDYPMYFFAVLGFWKFFGALTILVPRYPLLKEWAYAGIFFDLTGAAASCIAVGGYGKYGFHVLAPLVICAITVASWALRPASRRLTSTAVN